MKRPPWMLGLVFAAVSVPTVLILQTLELGGDYRLLIAMAAGAAATGLLQSSRFQRKDKP